MSYKKIKKQGGKKMDSCWWGERTCSCDECMLFECPYNTNWQEEEEEEEEEED